MEKHFKPILLVLLFGILVTLVAIYLKLPAPAPTLGAFQKASGEQRRLLIQKRPMVYVVGSVDVSGSVNIDNTPLEVEVTSGNVTVENTPLEVEVVR